MNAGKFVTITGAAAGLLAYVLLRRQGTSGTSVLPEAGSTTPRLAEVANRVDRTIAIPTAMCAASIAVWTRVSHGNTLRYTFVPSMALSWFLYMGYMRKHMPDPERITAFYFVALAWQLVHFVEENSTGFGYRWPVEIFETNPYGEREYVAINALSYAIFILGGVALMKRRPEFSLPAIFFSIMGVMYNGIQHPIYSWMAKGYFPGLWTGVVDLVIGPLLLRRLFSGSRTESMSVALPAAA